MITWEDDTTVWAEELRHTFRILRERRRQEVQTFHFNFDGTNFNRQWNNRQWNILEVATTEYDPNEKRWEVCFGNGSIRYFKTKRSALRFIKRLEDKANGIRKKKKITSPMKMKKYQEKIDDYLERLGI